MMRHNVRHQVYFSARQYGSRKAAEVAARKWEVKKIRELPARLTRKNLMTDRNRSGVVGVRLAKNVAKRKNGKRVAQWRWIAFWTALPGGIPWTIGARKYSDNDAFVLAYLSRQHESVNRKKMLKEFEKIYRTAKYKKILSQKKQSPK
ncbi:MAG: hypothetical protein PHP42_08015 [Bacteroidota bacterium]|nr:hypothetical protein [Bacteroidota bacterium]